jgi:hypothetical protein
MISVKDIDVFVELLQARYDRKLIRLVRWIVKEFGVLTVTSGYREGDSGVHGAKICRGLDIRSYVFIDPQAVCDKINVHWEYDYKRPELMCAIVHNVGIGRHIHLQVHPNTKER